MKFRPLHDRVVVAHRSRAEDSPAASSSPAPPQEKPQEGEVVAVGPVPATKRARSSPRGEGRRQGAVRQGSGTEVKIDGQDLLIMKESDILASSADAARPGIGGLGRRSCASKVFLSFRSRPQ